MIFKVALAQYPILFHQSEMDWVQAVQDFSRPANQAQVLVFPEYGSLDLTSLLSAEERRLKNQVAALQTHLTLFMETFGSLALRHQQIVVAPSFPVLHEGRPVNRTFVFSPKGLLGYQDKQVMTRFENEDWKIFPGDPTLKSFMTDFGLFGVNICYDVEFPRFAQALAQQGVHLLLAPSCTETFYGMNRVHVGARARALENQFYVGIAQTIGEALWSPAVDMNTGQALLCGPPDTGFPEDGVLAKGAVNQPSWVLHEVDLKKVEYVRTQGSVLNWKDSQELFRTRS